MANAAIKLDSISNSSRHVGINIDEDTEPTHTLEVNGTLDVSGLATFTRQTAPQILIQPNSDVGCQVRLDKKISESVTVQMALAISAQPSNYTHGLYSYTLGKWMIYGTDTEVIFNGKFATPRKIQGVDFDGSADITLPMATESQAGLVSTTTQTFAGTKTFVNAIQLRQLSYLGRLSFGNTATDSLGYIDYRSISSTAGTAQDMGRFQFLQWSYNSNTGARLDNYERFSLPSVQSNLSSNLEFDILTTKNTVTVAQGGTGAYTSSNARRNLGLPDFYDFSVTTTANQPYTDVTSTTVVNFVSLTTNSRAIVQRRGGATGTSTPTIYPVMCACGSDTQTGGYLRIFWNTTPGSAITINISAVVMP